MKRHARSLKPLSEHFSWVSELLYDHETTYILLLALSVWLPYYVSGGLLLGLAVYVLCSQERRRKVFRLRIFGTFVWLLPTVALLCSVVGENLLGAFISAAFFFILIAGFYARVIMTPERFEKCCRLLCLCSILAVILATIQNFVIYGCDPDYRPTATTSNPNFYGMLIVFSVCIALTRLSEKKYRLLYILTVILNVYALYICESRSSQLGLTVCILVYLILNKRRFLAGVFGLISVSAFLVGWRYYCVFSWANSLQYILTNRVQIWSSVLIEFSKTPLSISIGRGPMTYFLIENQMGTNCVKHAHNIYLDCLINYGIIGTGVFAVFGYHLAKSSLFRGLKGASRNIGILNTLILTGIAVSGIFDTTILYWQTAACVLLLHAGTGIVSTGAAAEIESNLGYPSIIRRIWKAIMVAFQ